MDQAVAELIRSGITGGAGSATVFYNLHNSSSRFSILQNKLADFIFGYCSLAYDDYRSVDDSSFPSHPLGLAESPDRTVPLVADFTLKFHLESDDDDGTDLMDENFVPLVVYCCQKAISDLYNLDEGLSEIICCVLEANTELSHDHAIIRLRLHFPFCQVIPDFVHRVLRPRIEQILRTKNPMSCLRLQPAGDWSGIIKTQHENYTLYGSNQSPLHNKMRLSHIYSKIDEAALKNTSEIRELDLADIFQPTQHSYVQRGMLSAELIESIDEDIDLYQFWLPLFLSVSYWSKIATPRADEKIVEHGDSIFQEDVISDNPKIMARYLLNILTRHRVEKEYYWLDIGRAIFNIYAGDDEGLEIWTAFSLRHSCVDRTAKTCRSRYETLRDTGLSIKTIAWYAREDNPEAYREWHTRWILPTLKASLSITNADVASAVYRMFWLEYYYDSSNDKWWHFQGHALRRTERAILLRKDINTRLVEQFDKMRGQRATEDRASIMSEMAVREREEIIKQLCRLIQKLKTESFISSVIKSCQAVGSADNLASGFDVPDFNRRIDSDPNKTGWADCVIECCGNQASVRKGKPEDYITKISPIGYRKDFHWKHPIVLEVMDFMKKVFVDNDLRTHVYKRLASILKGRNGEKLFDVLSGSGDNAKSIFVALIKAVFGTYAVDFPVSMLTGTNKNSGSASPELAQARGAHAAFVSEPDSGDEMKAGPIKRFTGNDTFFCRMLFDNGGSLESFIKLFYMCNRIPNIPNADKAVKNRLWVCPFLSTFCKDPISPENPDGYPLDEEEQYRTMRFKANPDFHTRIPELAYGMLWIMVQYYPRYIEEGLTPVPEIVTRVTSQHWNDNDAYVQFIQEKIENVYITNGDGTPKKDERGEKYLDVRKSLSVTAIFPVFNQWWRLYYPGAQIPDVRTLKAELTSKDRLGVQTGPNKWLGVAFKDGNAIVAEAGALGRGGAGVASKADLIPMAGGGVGGGLVAGLTGLGLVRQEPREISTGPTV